MRQYRYAKSPHFREDTDTRPRDRWGRFLPSDCDEDEESVEEDDDSEDDDFDEEEDFEEDEDEDDDEYEEEE